jgi:hypothetical protein
MLLVLMLPATRRRPPRKLCNQRPICYVNTGPVRSEKMIYNRHRQVWRGIYGCASCSRYWLNSLFSVEAEGAVLPPLGAGRLPCVIESPYTKAGWYSKTFKPFVFRRNFIAIFDIPIKECYIGRFAFSMKLHKRKRNALSADDKAPIYQCTVTPQFHFTPAILIFAVYIYDLHRESITMSPVFRSATNAFL